MNFKILSEGYPLGERDPEPEQWALRAAGSVGGRFVILPATTRCVMAGHRAWWGQHPACGIIVGEDMAPLLIFFAACDEFSRDPFY